MTDPNLAVEKAALALLRANGALSGLGAAVLDVVPQVQPFPYVEIGDGQLVAEPAEGFQHSARAYLSFNAYSREAGKPQVRKVCGAVLAALSGVVVDLGPDFYPVELTHENTRYFLEEDGLTHRGAVSFSALIDPMS